MKSHVSHVLIGLFSASVSCSVLHTRTSAWPVELTFDDGDFEGALPALGTPVGLYKGVQFSGINVANFNASLAFNTQSPPNMATLAFRSLIAVTPEPPFVEIATPKLTIDYPNSPFQSIDFISGYIGCAAMTGLAITFPVNCEVRFSAVYWDGHVEDIIAPFRPKSPLDPLANEDMQKVVFGDEFKGIKEMRIALESSQLPLGILLTAIGQDSYEVVLNKR